MKENVLNYFDGKIFMKVCVPILLIGGIFGTNYIGAYETQQKIKNTSTIERKIHEAERLKSDIKENWYLSPFLLGEYFVASNYLKKNQ